MKMGICNGAFWGIILILIGVGLLLKYVFNINFPVIRTVFALLILYIGVRMLIGGWCKNTCTNDTIFSESSSTYTVGQKEYNTVFSKGRLDLSSMQLNENTTIEVKVVFSDYEIKINPDLNYRIQSNTVFGNTSMPDNTNNSFGKFEFRGKSFNMGLPVLTINTNVVFGNLKVTY